MSLPAGRERPEPALPLAAEREWTQLRAQLDLAGGFWLGFLFTPSARVSTVFRERVDRLLHARSRTVVAVDIRPAPPRRGGHWLSWLRPAMRRQQRDGGATAVRRRRTGNGDRQ